MEGAFALAVEYDGAVDKLGKTAAATSRSQSKPGGVKSVVVTHNKRRPNMNPRSTPFSLLKAVSKASTQYIHQIAVVIEENTTTSTGFSLFFERRTHSEMSNAIPASAKIRTMMAPML